MKLDRFGIAKRASFSLAEAKASYLLAQEAQGSTEKTIESIRCAFLSLARFAEANHKSDGDLLDPQTVREYILNERRRGLKDRSVQSYLINLKAFHSWCVREGYADSNPFDRVKLPKVEQHILEAFTPAELNQLLKGTEGSDALSVRNRALVLCLLDSGLRASEMISLRIGDLDMVTGIATVRGKGRKQRHVRIGSQARKALLRYLQFRQGERGEPLWLGIRGPLTGDGLHEVLTKLGAKVNVSPCNPHKFRRTFALNCLRNGMDPFSLQILMGHADLQILRRYLAQTQADVERAHAEHSPVDRMLCRRSA